MSGKPARHDLLSVTAAGWSTLAATEPVLAGSDGMRFWRDRDLPVMARRPQPGDDPGAVPVCIALPLQFGRLRLAFCLPSDAIARIRPPVRPVDCLADATLPAPWRQRLHAVETLAASLSLQPAVYGSLLWQHLSGLACLRHGSDLDLLWRFEPGEKHRIEALLSALSMLDAQAGPRLDGEIVIAGRGAVSWRELALERDTLLLRTDTEACLVPRAWFLERIAVSC